MVYCILIFSDYLFWGFAAFTIAAASAADRLAEKVRAFDHKADFGILGAKFVPRALAENGCAQDAFQMITQENFPGWGWQVRNGATTLWENWNGSESQNHVMFGDISAWMYRYPAGIRPQIDFPGFSRFVIAPEFVKQLDWGKCSYRAPQGLIRSQWEKQKNGTIRCHWQIPSGCAADIWLPSEKLIGQSGTLDIEIPVNAG